MAEYKEYGYSNNSPGHTFFYLQSALQLMLDKNESRCILDLGCGNGHLVNYLLENGYNAYGTDASLEGIALAKESHAERFFVQDLSSGKLPKELLECPFDTIIATEVIEHLYDPEGLIRFCTSILGKGGEIILSTPYHGYWKNLVLSIFDKWDGHWAPGWYGGHIKFWSKKTLSRLLTENGYHIVAIKGCGRLPFFWMSMIIKAKLI